jgi:hypothetical protein
MKACTRAQQPAARSSQDVQMRIAGLLAQGSRYLMLEIRARRRSSIWLEHMLVIVVLLYV